MSGKSAIVDELRHCRSLAADGQLTKRPRAYLYDLLAICMDLAIRGDRDASELRLLEAEIRVQGVGLTGRRYVESSTDAFALVCRYVFPTDRARASRSACTIREAAKRQIRPANLSSYMMENGGANALFLARPLSRLTVTSKTIRLVEAVELPKTGTITLHLERLPDGVFRAAAPPSQGRTE